MKDTRDSLFMLLCYKSESLSIGEVQQNCLDSTIWQMNFLVLHNYAVCLFFFFKSQLMDTIYLKSKLI